jgi:hypothetical protein
MRKFSFLELQYQQAVQPLPGLMAGSGRPLIGVGRYGFQVLVRVATFSRRQ